MANQSAEKSALRKRYTVRLEVPMVAWALVPVVADDQAMAETLALEANTDGTVSYEYGGMDVRGAEVAEVQEETPEPLLPGTRLSERELATVLAALGYWEQEVLIPNDSTKPRRGDCYFGEHDPLTILEVDQLCKRLNGGGK